MERFEKWTNFLGRPIRKDGLTYWDGGSINKEINKISESGNQNKR